LSRSALLFPLLHLQASCFLSLTKNCFQEPK